MPLPKHTVHTTANRKQIPRAFVVTPEVLKCIIF